MDTSDVSRHLTVVIDRSAAEVYTYASNPAHLPEWAAGLGGSIERVGTRWFAESPMGNVAVSIVPNNPYGVLDHYVTLPSNEVVYNPLRVIPFGESCEVVFTLRRSPGVSDTDFEADSDAIVADLATLKRLLEKG